jgi:hypothetical protein
MNDTTGKIIIVRPTAPGGQTLAEVFEIADANMEIVTTFFDRLNALPPVRVLGRVRVTGKVINLRAGPDAAIYADLGDVVKGVEFLVFDESGPWVRVAINAWLKTGTLAEWIERYGNPAT